MAAAITFHPISSSTSAFSLRQKLRRDHGKNRSNSIIVCISEQATSVGFTSIKTQTLDPKPVTNTVRSFAPATVANLGPGFDFLGCAVDGLGDYVTVTIDPSVKPGTLSISSITGDVGVSKLTNNPLWNCAGIAGIEVMKMLKIRSVGLSLELSKGLPLGSGLGSSAASAAAAAVAVNGIFGSPLKKEDLVLACLESEAKVSGYHADNVGPAIMGGFVLIRSYDPFQMMKLSFPQQTDLLFVLVSPDFEAPTKKMRAVLPAEVSMKNHIHNSSQASAMVAAVMMGDLKIIGSALSSDVIVEPKRAALIPGMAGAKRAALDSGAYGCTISGAGPTAVAIVGDAETGKKVADAIVKAFWEEGRLKSTATITELDRVGARVV
ncbi:Homoserine kinase [Zostera marina]|uniref:Homoserine kinase n=1 Tax=Zostera marina TaxID=29655 RepID=A0A0K9NPA3_ZOSMR|nr:Homoserine kinase [Zostera marina]